MAESPKPETKSKSSPDVKKKHHFFPKPFFSKEKEEKEKKKIKQIRGSLRNSKSMAIHLPNGTLSAVKYDSSKTIAMILEEQKLIPEKYNVTTRDGKVVELTARMKETENEVFIIPKDQVSDKSQLVEDLCAASYSGNLAKVKELIPFLGEGDINLKNKRGQTAVYCAARQGNIKVLQELLGVEGVNPNIQENNGSTPLHGATFAGHTGALSLLLSFGSDIKIPNKMGILPEQEATIDTLTVWNAWNEGGNEALIRKGFPVWKETDDKKAKIRDAKKEEALRNRVKILIAGEDQQQKEALCNYFMGNKQPKVTKDTLVNFATQDVFIRTQQLKFTVCSLSGEYQETILPLLLSPKTIYLVVWSAEKPTTVVKRILKSIRDSLPTEPIFLVATDVKDESMVERAQAFVTSMGSLLTGVFTIYSASKKEFSTIKKALVEHAEAIIAQRPLTSSILQLEKKILQIKTNYIIKWSKFQTLANSILRERVKVTDTTDINPEYKIKVNQILNVVGEEPETFIVLLKDGTNAKLPKNSVKVLTLSIEDHINTVKTLHQLGSIVAIPKKDQKEYIVISKPHKLSLLLSDVFNYFLQNGEFDSSTIRKTLNHWRPPLSDYIQENYDIMYTYGNHRSKTVVIPTLLSETQEVDLHEDTTLLLKVGLKFNHCVNRVAYQVMREFKNSSELTCKQAWKSGMFLEKTSQNASIYIRFDEGEIEIIVRSEEKKFMVEKLHLPLFVLDVLLEVIKDEQLRVENRNQSDIHVNLLMPSKEIFDHGETVKIMKELAKGGFGTILSGEYLSQPVAIKRLISQESIVDTLSFVKEIVTMSYLNHPNIVNSLGYIGDPLSLLLEFVPSGDLRGYLNKNKDSSTDFPFRLRCAMDVALALAYMHSFNPPIVHRDLKSPNILLLSTDWQNNIVAKVADFGTTRILRTKTFKSKLARQRTVVNARWLPPEALNGKNSNSSLDVYGFGIILWELYTSEEPFTADKKDFEIEKDIINGERPPIPESCPGKYAQLMKKCWHDNSANRPAFVNVIQMLMDFIESLNNDALSKLTSKIKNGSSFSAPKFEEVSQSESVFQNDDSSTTTDTTETTELPEQKIVEIGTDEDSDEENS